MAEDKMRSVVCAYYFFECPREDYDRMSQWVASKAKYACENSQKGPLIVVMLDEHDEELGRTSVVARPPDGGLIPPSAELRHLADTWFEEEGEDFDLEDGLSAQIRETVRNFDFGTQAS